MRLEAPRAARIAMAICVPLLALLWLTPLAWTISAAIRPSSEVFGYASPLQWHTFIPASVTWDNIVTVLTGPIGRAIVNSLVVTAASVILGVLIAAMAAYGLVAFRFRGRGLLMVIIVLAFMVPFDGLAIPLASVVRDVGLENTYLALILPGLGNGLAVFLLRQFFLDIPDELREAAAVDGAGSWRIFQSVYLPLSGSALVGAGIIIFVFQWQAYLWPLLVTTDPSMDVGAVALGRLFGLYGVDWGTLFAGATVLSLIPALILLIFQRSFVASITGSAVKG